MDDRTDRIAHFRLAVRRVTRWKVATEPKRELSLDHRCISKIREAEAGRTLLRELAVQAPEERGMIHSLRPFAGAAGAANLPAHELEVQPFIQRVLDLPGLLKIGRHPIFSQERHGSAFSPCHGQSVGDHVDPALIHVFRFPSVNMLRTPRRVPDTTPRTFLRNVTTLALPMPGRQALRARWRPPRTSWSHRFLPTRRVRKWPWERTACWPGKAGRSVPAATRDKTICPWNWLSSWRGRVPARRGNGDVRPWPRSPRRGRWSPR